MNKPWAPGIHYIGTEPEEKKQIEDEMMEDYRVLDLAVQEKTDQLNAEWP